MAWGHSELWLGNQSQLDTLKLVPSILESSVEQTVVSCMRRQRTASLTPWDARLLGLLICTMRQLELNYIISHNLKTGNEKAWREEISCDQVYQSKNS